jgi:hypothetical protein
MRDKEKLESFLAKIGLRQFKPFGVDRMYSRISQETADTLQITDQNRPFERSKVKCEKACAAWLNLLLGLSSFTKPQLLLYLM